MKDGLEAVIIGSGFGGAINACRLGKKWPGKVMVLERGKRYLLGGFPRSPHDISRNFWITAGDRTPRPTHIQKARLKAGHDLRGMFDVRTYDHMDVVLCAGLGGGSLIYANVFMIPPDDLFSNPRWPATCQKRCLEPYYAIAKTVLGSQPVPLNGDPRRHLRKTEVFQQVATKIGRQSELVDINVFFGPDASGHPLDFGEQGRNHYGARQTSCTYCGECILGCNYHAKNTLDLNYLRMAELEHGVKVMTECIAEDIAPLNERGEPSEEADGRFGYVVTYVSLIDGQRTRIPTRRVVVSAGALGSTELLLRCKRRYLKNISPRLGSGFSGNGDFLSFVIEGPHTDPNRGPTITQRIDFNLFANFAPSHAFILEDASYPPLLAWFVEGLKPRFAWIAPLLRTIRHVLKTFSRSGKSPGTIGFAFADLLQRTVSYDSAVLLCMGVDSSDGVMSVDDAGEFCLSWPQQTSMELYNAILEAGKAFQQSLGWKRFIPSPTWYWPIRNNVTVHPLGGCVLADDPLGGVTSAERSSFGQVFGYTGLYVADGAIVPTGVGANPTATISALSEIVAEGITHISPNASLR